MSPSVESATPRPAGGAPARPVWFVEVIVVLLGAGVFAYLHGQLGKDLDVATANAAALQSAERTLHLDIEHAPNDWLVDHPALIPAAVSIYRLHFAVIVTVLVWVYIRDAEVYRRARRTLLAMLALVLPVFWALPMSPPRFAMPGIVDIVAEHDILARHASPDGGVGQNNYSAMPSMHVGWSAWCAFAVWSALRSSHPRLALVAWLYPLVMVVDVLATGNHYVLDIVGSAVLLLGSIAAASLGGHLAKRWRGRTRTSGADREPDVAVSRRS